jgi:hypothetical protein
MTGGGAGLAKGSEAERETQYRYSCLSGFIRTNCRGLSNLAGVRAKENPARPPWAGDGVLGGGGEIRSACVTLPWQGTLAGVPGYRGREFGAVLQFRHTEKVGVRDGG